MRTHSRFGIWFLGFGVCLGIWDSGFGISAAQQSQVQPGVTGVLNKATAYADRFHDEFASFVAEERYEQRVVRGFGASSSRSTGLTSTVLLSDFLLVQVTGEGWMPFRDVFERDGRKVRDREDRLAALFLKGSDRSSFEQARKIMNEGARYNIGNVDRNINAPTLVLQFLTPLHRHRFTFVTAGTVNGLTLVEFRESSSPTFISTTNGRDLPASGRFWFDEEEQVVTKTELDAVDTSVECHITVTYRRDDALGLWVPARMEERYRRPGDSMQVTGVATYSRFRRFQVTTSEDVGAPADK